MKQTSKREVLVTHKSNSLTRLCMSFIGDCPECGSHFFACEKHGRLVAAINVASEALTEVFDAVHDLERKGA